jgi:hypothetical protein
MKAILFFAAALTGTLAHSAAAAAQHGGTWVSVPQSLITIAVGEDGGHIAGPGWEHRFKATARNLDFEIEPGRRFVLRRSGNTWVGNYFHPRIRPGTHKSESHKMTFVRKEAAGS